MFSRQQSRQLSKARGRRTRMDPIVQTTCRSEPMHRGWCMRGSWMRAVRTGTKWTGWEVKVEITFSHV